MEDKNKLQEEIMKADNKSVEKKVEKYIMMHTYLVQIKLTDMN